MNLLLVPDKWQFWFSIKSFISFKNVLYVRFSKSKNPKFSQIVNIKNLNRCSASDNLSVFLGYATKWSRTASFSDYTTNVYSNEDAFRDNSKKYVWFYLGEGVVISQYTLFMQPSGDRQYCLIFNVFGPLKIEEFKA